MPAKLIDMTLTKQALKDIRQFAKFRVGGFGMRLELALKSAFTSTGEDLTLGSTEYTYNMLTPCTSMDLADFSKWKGLAGMDIPSVKGFVLLDFYVYDTEELRDNVQALLNEAGEVVKLWQTYYKRKELADLIGWNR